MLCGLIKKKEKKEKSISSENHQLQALDRKRVKKQSTRKEKAQKTVAEKP